MSKKINVGYRVIISIFLFLIIDQLFENLVVFNGLNLIYKHSQLTQSITNYLFKLIEILVVLVINHFITKQKFYFKRKIKTHDVIFIVIVALFLLLRSRSLSGPELLNGLLTGLAGGVPEELLTRGVIMGKLLSYVTRNKCTYPRILLAVIPSTIIFGLLHLNNLGQTSAPYLITQIIITAASGLVFSAIYIRTGSLWYAMLLHFLVDFITQAGSSVGSASGAGLTMASIQSIIWTYLIVSLILFFVILPPTKKVPRLVKNMHAIYSREK